jgi:hypothetical protein
MSQFNWKIQERPINSNVVGTGRDWLEIANSSAEGATTAAMAKSGQRPYSLQSARDSFSKMTSEMF